MVIILYGCGYLPTNILTTPADTLHIRVQPHVFQEQYHNMYLNLCTLRCGRF